MKMPACQHCGTCQRHPGDLNSSQIFPYSMSCSQVGSLSTHCSRPHTQIRAQQTRKGNRTIPQSPVVKPFIGECVQCELDDSRFALGFYFFSFKKKNTVKCSKYLNSVILGMSTSRFQYLHTLSLHQLSYALSRRTQYMAL